MFLSGFTDELLNHTADTILPTKYKIGFTNMVARATPGSKDLSRYQRGPSSCRNMNINNEDASSEHPYNPGPVVKVLYM